MSGYLQYSNYGEDEKPPTHPTQSIQSTQSRSTQPTQSTQQHKRTLRANPRTLRSKQPDQIQLQQQQQQQQPQQNQPQQPQIQHNQNQNPQTKYAQDLIKRMHNSVSGSDSESDSDSNEHDMHKQFQTEQGFNHTMYSPANSTDLNAKLNPASAKEGFASKTLANSNPKQYPQYMSSVFQASSDPENKDAMLQKLDHIIALLEDQHDEKTGHVTEELVLYCFLGVFIIFIVDSFARAGKYVR